MREKNVTNQPPGQLHTVGIASRHKINSFWNRKDKRTENLGHVIKK